MWKRIWTLFKARNKEYYRDKSALGWNLLFPFLIIIGFNLIFGSKEQNLYKVGIIEAHSQQQIALQTQYEKFRKTRYVEFVSFNSEEHALDSLKHHRIDLLVKVATGQYWVNDSSPNGYIAERLLQVSRLSEKPGFFRQDVQGRQINYVAWLFPGILAMNVMFSSLFGVGYVVVRYRKNGVLKRMSVTPVRPWEFLTAQVVSRMFLLLLSTTIVYTGCVLLYGFECLGSYLALVLVFALGGFSMVALGLLVACRISSEEFVGGILNMTTYPMMFLSEVWFSLEGSQPWVQQVAFFFPLFHLVKAARKIMNDGAGFMEVQIHVYVLLVMSIVFLSAGSLFFKWQKD